MFKNVIMFLVLMSIPFSILAQDDEIDELPFEDEPLREESLNYFALAGGPTVDWLMVDEAALNQLISNFNPGTENKFEGPLFMSGGHGFTGIPWVKNLRIGVFGLGGSIETELEDRVAATGPDSEFEQSQNHDFTVSMFGFSVHYGWVPIKNLAILGGVNAGWGDMNYEYRTNINEFDWENMDKWRDISNRRGVTRLENDFFFATPDIQIEYALTNFLMIRARAGYNLTFGQGEEWTMNANGTMNNVPTDIKSDGFVAGAGIFIGLINF